MSDTLIDQPTSPESIYKDFTEHEVNGFRQYFDKENTFFLISGTGKVDVEVGDSPAKIWPDRATNVGSYFTVDGKGTIWIRSEKVV